MAQKTAAKDNGNKLIAPADGKKTRKPLPQHTLKTAKGVKTPQPAKTPATTKKPALHLVKTAKKRDLDALPGRERGKTLTPVITTAPPPTRKGKNGDNGAKKNNGAKTKGGKPVIINTEDGPAPRLERNTGKRKTRNGDGNGNGGKKPAGAGAPRPVEDGKPGLSTGAKIAIVAITGASIIAGGTFLATQAHFEPIVEQAQTELKETQKSLGATITELEAEQDKAVALAAHLDAANSIITDKKAHIAQLEKDIAQLKYEKAQLLSQLAAEKKRTNISIARIEELRTGIGAKDRKIAAYEQALRAVRGEKARLKSENTQLRTDKTQLETDRATLTTENAALAADNEQLSTDLDVQRTANDALSEVKDGLYHQLHISAGQEPRSITAVQAQNDLIGETLVFRKGKGTTTRTVTGIVGTDPNTGELILRTGGKSKFKASDITQESLDAVAAKRGGGAPAPESGAPTEGESNGL